jgi:hypothetical protein
MPQVEDLLDLEAQLASALKGLRTGDGADLQAASNSIKQIALAHAAKAQEARAAALLRNDPVSLHEVKTSSERLAALQTEAHHLLIASRNKHARRAVLTPSEQQSSRRGNDPSDSYAADITSRLSDLNARIVGHVDASQSSLQSLERSARSIKTLSTRYKDFGAVSVESRRLVSRHAAKKKRDLLLMQAAVGLFFAICLFIFLKRLPFLLFVLRLLNRFAKRLLRPEKTVPDVDDAVN